MVRVIRIVTWLLANFKSAQAGGSTAGFEDLNSVAWGGGAPRADLCALRGQRQIRT
jgi:hypothetical protein